MRVLVIGSGGREHALAWKIAASPLLTRLYAAPGNPGIGRDAELVKLDIADHAAVAAFCKDNAIDLVVVGPEGPLVAGIADDLRGEGIRVFGPSKRAARLEGSKGFTKDLCAKYDIPTAAYGRFADLASAKAYVEKVGAPIVIKADGLAAGKGVTIAMTLDEAIAALDACFDGAFGAAGAEVVVEEFLTGEEASFFCLCDGTTALPFGTAQDHKRVGDGDVGPNTGGMGAYSPAPVMTPEMVERTMREIIEPTMRGMAELGAPFAGILFAGLMITDKGPKLIEYNTRFGDPECQVLMMRLKDDLLVLLNAAVDGQLAHTSIRWRDEAALTVVMAARGYPGTPEKGSVIRGLEEAASDGAEIFHAGTAINGGALVANGGRVLNVTATGATVGEAQQRAYAALDRIDWPQGFCRRDIGWQAVAREKAGA
ncbi:phosphoribosylamine--glycine ligase [Mesorhizobium sp. M4B.F.Ca.ET.215.01.1.1]|uniref:phosphoribosylamine--glycine ligase n=1 Tax=unclassified Mesorhizobium TaxID=325217 RepID=UPI000FCCD69C|nr:MULTISPECIES: phosphoribosylamine--glycine ligase [unclassified Mesorhizobium]RUW25845.1 phosphoribosylamine--glycine ligase [Mesorhizobium sp. M4B.F.Ca.ET.013.02.1.1]RVD39927.1 phosphoribosylamine--glycine ligase [Mesorhizobium sp. M4B.F.Ca.ET.019.03.1.1]RWF67029.1 MAG: phosphoribosylamine--glycine ligase [Mesorhizobium sp.]TGQ18809.1 phosphoribosylamine--glycine ligase [Mesorhizobium sp. M4B.F.Ca.ET.215.01.1.1]TGQ40469.1 phosphoribosylamine--glycine ligase [Mesorhizobium sp. M4B.F.Ca.ET.2